MTRCTNLDNSKGTQRDRTFLQQKLVETGDCRNSRRFLKRECGPNQIYGLVITFIFLKERREL